MIEENTDKTTVVVLVPTVVGGSVDKSAGRVMGKKL